jgi:hypothetical protein
MLATSFNAMANRPEGRRQPGINHARPGQRGNQAVFVIGRMLPVPGAAAQLGELRLAFTVS